MKPLDDDSLIVAEIRRQSRRFVQSVFAGFSLLFAVLALLAHHSPGIFSLPIGEMPRIAAAFLFLSGAYALTIFVWEWLFEPHASPD